MRFDQLGGDDDDLEGFVVAEPEAPDAGLGGGVRDRRRRRRRVVESDSEDHESPRSPGSRSDSGSSGWVHCECGACEDDGTHMVQCENPRCGAWQHLACVDRDANDFARAFFWPALRVRGGARARAAREARRRR